MTGLFGVISRIRRRTRGDADDSGSIVLALVFVMVTAMLLTLMTAALMQEVSKTKNDRSFTSALPAADAGIQDATGYLNSARALPIAQITNAGAANYCNPLDPASCPIAVQGTTTQATGRADYRWFVSADASTSPQSYTVHSATTVNGVTRVVHAQLYQDPQFAFALFADQGVTFNGGNTATSYPASGSGQIGTNTTITLHGNGSTSADICVLYDSDAQGTSSNRATGPCGTTSFVGPRKDITSTGATQFISDAIAACPQPIVDYAGQQLDANKTYCFANFNMDGNTVVNGTSSAPTKVFVTGNITIANHTSVHASGAQPDSAGFQIYSLGTSFQSGNHSSLGAAVWAPKATCGGGAQATIFGSLVCGSIGNVGGWTFDYDTRLGSIGGGGWKMRHYSEYK